MSSIMLCYFYISCILISKKLWLFDDSLIDISNKAAYHIAIQKYIIHTMIDLLNSIVEADIELESTNFLYRIINSRIFVKLITLFKYQNIYTKIEESFYKNIGYNNAGKNVSKKMPIYILI